MNEQDIKALEKQVSKAIVKVEDSIAELKYSCDFLLHKIKSWQRDIRKHKAMEKKTKTKTVKAPVYTKIPVGSALEKKLKG
ncbi:hypothetical protein ES705_11042 [subsurface metagenome]